ncbi:tripartite tricarboxylate transporter TctB family protein [Bacillus horti]|uniref:DUF1468 domain-containing protein n=1 Tax=Caldalkalibacillus horti TaxID=77523 RepID=A0ABT9W159_9BACI|nr:tripartite tricarboxylate transporter TctB family protein [Bacillus horti]MDQ0166989.1 hypothetical protein [Bacillus horti]
MTGYFKKNITNTVTGLIMIIVSVIILYLSFTMRGHSVTNPGEGSFIPALTAFVMLICGFGTMLGDYRKHRSQLNEATQSQSSEQASHHEEQPQNEGHGQYEGHQQHEGQPYHEVGAHQSVDPVKSGQTDLMDDDEAVEYFSKSDIYLLLLFAGVMLLYIISIQFVPFFIASFFYLVATMMLLKGVKWLTIIITSAVSLTVMYFLFVRLFHIVFP